MTMKRHGPYPGRTISHLIWNTITTQSCRSIMTFTLQLGRDRTIALQLYKVCNRVVTYLYRSVRGTIRLFNSDLYTQ